MKTMYHCTKRTNLKEILRHGLIPSKPPEGYMEGVYLSKDPFAWMHRANEKSTVAGALIEIDVKGLKLIKDKNEYISDNNKKHKSYIYQGVISPERFKRISVSTDEKPCIFDHYVCERCGAEINPDLEEK